MAVSERIVDTAKLIVALMGIFVIGILVVSRSGPIDPWVHKEVGSQYDRRLSALEQSNLELQHELEIVQSQAAAADTRSTTQEKAIGSQESEIAQLHAQASKQWLASSQQWESMNKQWHDMMGLCTR